MRKRLSIIKGLDQTSSSSKSADTKCNPPLNWHIIQQESIRVEPESHHSSTPLLLNKPSGSKCESDYFIRLWNSEVGESFRNINESASEWGDGAASHNSPASQTSSFLTKVESGFRSTNLSEPFKADEMFHQKMDIFNCKKEPEDVAAYSVSSKSCDELDDSPEAMLKLLLDFPVGEDDDMDFLQFPNDNVSTDIQH